MSINADLIKNIITDLRETKIQYDAIQIKTFGIGSEGYNIAYLVEILNEVTAKYGCTWSFTFKNITKENDIFLYSEIQGKDKLKKMISVLVDFYIKDENKDRIFEYQSFGGCHIISDSMGDSLKGAQTDALKKAFSYIGLGGEAFKGAIDDQIRAFMYYKECAITDIKAHIHNTYEMEKKTITNKVLVTFISKSVKKKYDDLDKVTEKDFKTTLYNITEKELSNAKSRPRKSEAKVAKKPVDMPEQENK